MRIRDAVNDLAVAWRRTGYDLALGHRIAQGFATLGRIGFEGRFDYAAIGSVTNLAARLCSDAGPWQVLVTDRILAAIEHMAVAEDGRRRATQGIQPDRAGPQHHVAMNEVEHMTQLQSRAELWAAERRRALPRFDDLQLAMASVWDSIQQNLEDESVVVVPSISIERTTASSGTVTQAMEERALFLLLLLRQPRLRMIYVTSQPISEAIIEYYLGLLPGVIPSHARARLTLVSVGDGSPTSLSAKLLARPTAAAGDPVADPEPGPLPPDSVQHHPARARRRAVAWAFRCTARIPRLVDLGSKTGCRRMFEECGVQYPIGAEDLHTVDDIVAARAEHARATPVDRAGDRQAQRGRVGCGQRVGGPRRLPAPGAPDEAAAIARAPAAIRTRGRNAFRRRLIWPRSPSTAASSRSGSPASHCRSPSVQMRALPDGTVELLSTHDQLLGGASGQKYLGCVFPADPAYAASIAEPAMVVGRHLAQRGVLGPLRGGFRCRARTSAAPGRRTRSS